jgi:hypothetical protein
VSRTGRIVTVLASTAVVIALIAWYVVAWVVAFPPTVKAATSSAGTRLTLQTVASYGHAPHPDWVSYLIKNAGGEWVHSTVFQVPANSVVTVTIYQYDTATGLRNPFLSQPRGVLGGEMTVDGKPLHVLDPDLASHTFTIPDLGVSVPLKGVADDAPRQCAVTPCTLAQAHTTVTFRFHTGAPGWHRWQCFVPCGAGWIFGNGGPMQSMGWMDGYLHVD